MAIQVNAMLQFHQQGIPVFDYGNNIRQMAKEMGVQNALIFQVLCLLIFVLYFVVGRSFRWVALSGDPEDIYRTDEK